MEQNKPLLSICIPTYNGASSLLVTILDSLLPAIQKFDGGIEVVVSDNCSVDNTNSILNSYNKYKYYRHVRNLHNIGFNGNMLQLADKYANGVYTWFIGDDDIINPHFLPFLYDCLKSDKYDYISVSFERINLNNLGKTYKQQLIYRIESSSFAEAIDKNCLRGNTLGSFMSSAVFRTSIFKSMDKNIFENRFDSYYNIFPNAYLMATGFFNKRCAMIKQVCILAIFREKDWATTDNMYKIVSNALVEMYNYFISLGIKQEELIITRRRIVYDNLRMGVGRIVKGMRINSNFFSFLIESLKYPKIYYVFFVNLFKRLTRKNLIDID